MATKAGPRAVLVIVDLELRAFGPLEVRRDGSAVEIHSRLRQVLLAVLLVHRGTVVPTSTLTEQLWPARPPVSVVKSLHIHVYRLRRLLGDANVVRHHPPGYSLAVPGGAVDVDRFEDMVQSGRAALAGGDEAAAADVLRQADALYRGPAFQGLEDVDDLAVEAHRLAKLRMVALEDRIAAELLLGEQVALVAELEALVAEHPLHERFRAQLMTALYRTGRQVDALAVFRAGRQILRDELGVEPNAECRALEKAIRTHDRALDLPPRAVPRASPPMPRQLPPDVTAFTGRDEELRRLDALLPATEDPSTVVISVVEGTAGVGKTALTVHWAHRVRDRFPDGQLYVDLRGHSHRPALPPIAALAQFLRALGVSAQRMPAEVDEAASLYRSLLADRRMLVVLDNAADAEQARPLLPGGGRCLVIVTSRGQLTGLVARNGAHRLSLAVMTPDESRTLLNRALGAQRVAAEPDAVTELAKLCGHLPLALRIAAANLTARPRHSIATYIAQLRHSDRLAALTVPGDEQSAVLAAFDLSYNRLPDVARRMFRLLGLAPGPDITAPAAAALIDTTSSQAGRLLDVLAAAHLVEEHSAGRYAFHDLLRPYAAGRAHREETETSLQAALARLYSYYVHSVDAAARLLYAEKIRLPLPADLAVTTSSARFSATDHVRALAWLDDERPCLVAAVSHAASAGPRPMAWLLADALRGFFWLRKYVVDWLAVGEAGLAAAEADGELSAAAAARISLADALQVTGRYQQAIAHYRQALRAMRRTGSVKGERAILNNLGTVYMKTGELRQAADHFTTSLRLRPQTDVGGAPELGNLGEVYRAQGQLARAVDHFTQALTECRVAGNRGLEAMELSELGQTYHALGRFADALDQLNQALPVHQLVGDRVGEAQTHRRLSALYLDTGGPAAHHAHTALTIARDAGERQVEADVLNTLGDVHRSTGQHRQAIDLYREALDLAQQVNSSYVRANALIGLSTTHIDAAEHRHAGARVTEALAVTRDFGYRLLEGRALTALAEMHLGQNDTERAIRSGTQALDIHSETGHRIGQARTHLVLGRAQQSAGRPDLAQHHWRHAHHLLTDIGAPEADEVAALLHPAAARRR